MKTPRFTVAVIAHQTEPYLMQALDSVSAQTFPDFECLMIVEESTD
ncbi:MAG TPA: family 2 glycosyl transferase, partial [Lentisphaeria bacterium]|nr:family 2 glycosyl transferase [Lentisphaeria bacterium]